MEQITETHELISEAIKSAERSQAWVANKTGIPVTSLRRKLRGLSEFQVTEVALIAEVLNMQPFELLPKSFQRDVVA